MHCEGYIHGRSYYRYQDNGREGYNVLLSLMIILIRIYGLDVRVITYCFHWLSLSEYTVYNQIILKRIHLHINLVDLFCHSQE